MLGHKVQRRAALAWLQLNYGLGFLSNCSSKVQMVVDNSIVFKCS